MKTQLLRYFLAIIGIFSFVITYSQQPGSLDLGFGIGGKVMTNFSGGSSNAQSVVIQNDGKMVVAGYSWNGINNDFALARYNSNGSLDNTFGFGGKVNTDLGSDDYAFSVAVQSDGKILVAGWITGDSNPQNTGREFALVRYNSNGSLDNSFDFDGKVITDVGAFDVCQSVAVQSDGKIVLAGSTAHFVDFSDSDIALVRYNSNGSLDNTFDTDGKVITAIGNSVDIARSVAIQSDGKILVAGGSSSDFALVRYKSDGNLDTTFGIDGKVTTDIESTETGQSVAIQSDGKIVVAGSSGNGSSWDFALVRYNSNGGLDNTFDYDGKVTTDLGSYHDIANSLSIKSNGKIMVAGHFATPYNFDFALVCYNSDGSLDNTFSEDGIVTTAISSANNDEGHSVAIQNDGKIVVAGYSTRSSDDRFASVRYNSNGSLDDTFGENGKVTTGLGSADDYSNSIAIQRDGKIVLAGESNGDFALARYNSNGILDNTFGENGKVITDVVEDIDSGKSVAIQSDDKIIVAGVGRNFDSSDSNFALMRYNSNGSLDNSFDHDGKVITDFGSSNSFGTAVNIQSDGKVVMAGSTWDGFQYDFALVRYNINGSLDNTFGNNGKVITDLGGYHDDYATAMTLQKDGKIIVAGYRNKGSSSSPDTDFSLVRYNSNGSPDNSFGIGGMITTAVGNSNDFGNSVAIQNDNKVVVAGYSSNGYNWDFALVRYKSDGTLDNTFSSDGKVTTDVGNANDYGNSIAIQSNGKIIVAGYIANGDQWDFALVCYKSDGSLDGTFGAGGKVITDLGSVNDIGSKMALQNDGKILLSGYIDNGSNYDFALARYNMGTLGIEENSFVNNSVKVYPNPFSSTATITFSLNQSEKVSVKIFDLNGRLIRIISNGVLEGGKHSLTFDAEQLDTGIYFLQLQGEDFFKTEKIVFSK
ncbi:T9SS type A sorting domain-containing protein [Flavobacterium enshiense]|uniref:T9SS type A sorting domain-containing protein n=1 Tax=Flavobacterium enshiense TaxID=1341165 RepID=UPI00068622B7|nr:T9SS type A sorting domain-containing protein [Flavobacterium enshiense]